MTKGQAEYTAHAKTLEARCSLAHPGLEVPWGILFCLALPYHVDTCSRAYHTPDGNLYPLRKGVSGPFLTMSLIFQPLRLGERQRATPLRVQKGSVYGGVFLHPSLLTHKQGTDQCFLQELG